MKTTIFLLFSLVSTSLLADCGVAVFIKARDEQISMVANVEAAATEALAEKGYTAQFVDKQGYRRATGNSIELVLMNNLLDQLAEGAAERLLLPNGGVGIHYSLNGEELKSDKKYIFTGSMNQRRYSGFTRDLLKKVPACSP